MNTTLVTWGLHKQVNNKLNDSLKLHLTDYVIN